MSEKILFQQDRLTVTDEKITVGNATIFYPSVSATSIYEGRPLVGMGIGGIAAMLPLGFFVFVGARLFGPHFPLKTIAIMLLPLLAMAVIGFTYKVKCLFLGFDGGTVAVLKSRDRFELEVAQRAIEDARRAHGGTAF